MVNVDVQKPQLYSMVLTGMKEKRWKETKQQEVVTLSIQQKHCVIRTDALHEDQQSGMYENTVISHYTQMVSFSGVVFKYLLD